MIIHQTKKESEFRFPFFILSFSFLLMAGCSQSEQESNVVARVNNTVLTQEMIRNSSGSERPLTQSEIQQFANRWVINELLYQEARQRGLHESEQVQRTVNEALKQLSIAELLEVEVYQDAEASIEQNTVAAYFQQNSSEFILKEPLVRLSLAIFQSIEPAIKFRTAVLRDNAWTPRLDEVRSDAEQGLISSSDSIFYSQSTLYPPELWKVASALGMLEVSFPVKTSVGYVVMRSLGQFKAGTNAPLSFVEGQIRNRLVMEQRQQKYQQYLQNLRSRHTVQMMFEAQDTLSGDR